MIDYFTVNQNASKFNLLYSKYNCSENFLQIYDGGPTEKFKKIHYCSNEHNVFFKSEKNRVFIRYSLNKFSDRLFVDFKLYFNPFQSSGNYFIYISKINSLNILLNKRFVF